MTRLLASLFSLLCIGVVIGLGAVAGVVHYYGRDLPSHEALQNYHPPLISRVYARDGQPIAEFLKERRIFVPIDEFPALMKNAVIAAEDKNFYSHPGFDLRGIVSAVIDKAKGERMRGASTITQQVMKNFLLTNDRELERKIKEIILATRIEQVMSKDQILELYLNEFELGQRAHGFAAAAQNYFGKSIEDLEPQEAALLAALLKGPTDLNPVRHPERALERRNYVLGRMRALDFLTEEETATALASPLETIRRTKFTADAEALFALSDAHGVGGLVLGLPRNMDGSEGPRCQSTRQFATNLLTRRDIAIAFWDERLSTAAVERAMISEGDVSRARRAEAVDRLAAAYILQGYLDSLRR